MKERRGGRVERLRLKECALVPSFSGRSPSRLRALAACGRGAPWLLLPAAPAPVAPRAATKPAVSFGAESIDAALRQAWQSRGAHACASCRRQHVPPPGLRRHRRDDSSARDGGRVPREHRPRQAEEGRRVPARVARLLRALDELLGRRAHGPRGEGPRRRSRRLPLLAARPLRGERAVGPHGA